MVAGMTRQVALPEDDPERLRILAFACENDACPALIRVTPPLTLFPQAFRVLERVAPRFPLSVRSRLQGGIFLGRRRIRD